MKMVKYILIFGLMIIHAQAFGQAGSLMHYLEIAEQNNQGVQSALTLYRASLERVPQAGALEDPQFDFGIGVSIPAQPGESWQIDQYQFQVMQMFPWFGTRKAARTEMGQMAKMAFEQYREARDQLRLDVYTQWVTLGFLNQQLINYRANKQLLHQLEELALRRFASPPSGGAPAVSGAAAPSSGGAMSTATPSGSLAGGTGSMGGMSGMGGSAPSQPQGMAGMGSASMGQEGMSSMGSGGGMSAVLRIHIEIAEIDNAIESVLSEIQAETAKFNALLNRRADSEVHIPDTLIQEHFVFDEASIMTLIKDQNPMLGMISAEIAAIIAKTQMDRRMSYPMIGIGLQYTLAAQRSQSSSQPTPQPPSGGHGDPMPDPMGGSSNGSMSGSDMFMPMLSIRIPIYRGKYRARRRENDLMLQAQRERYANELNMIEAELHSIKSSMDNAERRIALYRMQSELANTMHSLALQEFASGSSDLAGVIQAQRQLLDYELQTAEAVANYNVMAAQIQKLISSTQ